MSRTVRLDTLREDVRFRGDFGGATVRHTDAQLTRLINQSIQMFRERISDEGSTHYLVPYSGTLGVGPTSPFAFYQLDLSSGPSPALVRTYSIEVTIDGQVCKLDHVPFEARNDYGTIPGGSRPVAWFHFRTDQVGILPASSAAYPFTVWYLPKLADLAADSDTFDGVAGWEEWVVWDVICQVIARDQLPQAYAIAEQRRAEVEQRVIRGATKVTQAGGAHVGRDSFGSKLPHFLGGSRRPQAVAGGPYVPASGSVTNAMLADMTGPTVKGVMSGTTRPQDVQVATLTTYLGLFNTAQRGLVPPPVTTSNLFLRDDGTWASAAGSGQSVGASGAIQFQGGAGSFGNASGFAIIGTHPSLIARLDGSMRVTGGQVEVGSGTVRISASGIDVGNGSIVNVATLVAQDASLKSLSLQSGLAHSQIQAVGSGMFLGNLSGTGTPSPVAVATMHAFAPTFTAAMPGTVPHSGGGTTNFLRADGTWTTPAAGAAVPSGIDFSVQFNSGGAFGGATGVRIGGSGTSLRFGVNPAATGLILAPNNTTIVAARNVANDADIPVVQITNSNQLLWGSTSQGDDMYFDVAAGKQVHFRVANTPAVDVSSTQVDFNQKNLVNAGAVAASSLTLASGIGNAYLDPIGSGMFKGRLSGTGAVQDVAVQTMLAFAPTFTSTTPGYVPPSGGGTSNFLRADGAWDVPPGTGGGGGGPTMLAGGQAGSIQYNSGSGLAGTEINTATPYISGSGRAMSWGSNAPTGSLGGGLNWGNGVIVRGRTSSGLAQSIIDWRVAGQGGGIASGAVITYGNVGDPSPAPTGDIQAQRWSVRPSGTFHWFIGPSGPASMRLMETGLDARAFHVAAKSIAMTEGVASFTTALSEFNDTDRGVVPESGGGTANFLRADGSWAVPPGGSSTQPSGIAGSVQFRGAAGFEGGTGIRLVGSGQSFAYGTTTAASGSNLFGTDARVAVGKRLTGESEAVLMQWGAAPDSLQIGAGNGATATVDYLYLDAAPTGRHFTRLGGVTKYEYSGSGADWNLMNLSNVNVGQFRALSLSSGITNALFAPMGSGTVKANLTGTGTPSDVPIATLLAFAPTFTSARAGVVPNSDGAATSFLAGDGAWRAPSGGHQFPPVGGATNAQLAVMATGTVKANLSGNATPSDVSVATLFAFSPTFTATRTGDVPASGGGTTNYLRADGTWSTPPGQAGSPGGGLGAVQYHDGAGFGGGTGISITASGQALGFGVPSFLPGAGDIRAASGFNITANLPSGIGGVAARQSILDWSGGGASGVLKVGGASGILGTHRSEVATGGAFEWLVGGQTGMSLRATGIDARAQHISAKSFSVGHINGLPFDFNGLKRGLDIGNSSGLPSGLSLYLPRGAGSGANRYLIPSGVVGTGTQAAPGFVTLNPTGGRGGGVIRIERISDGGWPFEVRTPTGTTLHSFPSGTKGWADFMFEKPSGAVFQLAGHADMF